MVFQVEALGGLRLVAADGQVVQAQRRRLALLALLAAAGEHGLTREQLVGCLWPETTQNNAKHALNQLLYGIRRSLSEDAVPGVDPVRLDPAVVDSDVRRFERALSAGEYHDAVVHYRGPFLNGFYLADAPEFERWVERERARLAAAHADALERLAAEAESRGDAPAAVTWRRALVQLDPLDARRATALMRALAAAGDSAGAIAHSRTYEALVRSELDAPPDPAVVALASEIRAPSEQQPITAAGPLSDPGFRHRATGDDGANGSVAQPMVGARPRRMPRVLVYGLAALAVAVVSFSARQWTHNRHDGSAVAATPDPSIAVLPLTNLSADPVDAALADGMTEELIAMLSRVGDLRVIASTSVYALRDRRMDVRQIAESLRVSHVLEGGLQKVGRRLRMQVRLIDARDGSTRWSETYDREMGDIFVVQDEISRAVTHALNVQLAGGGRARQSARRHTPSIEAYEWYLRGMDQTLRRGQALEYFNRAIAADSNFAAAYAGLVHEYIGEAADAPGNKRESFARAEQAALKAVALDDSLAEAHVGLGRARIVQRDWAGAEAALKQALALDPRAPRAFEALALLYLWTGRPAEQLSAARAGMEIDPLSRSAISQMALALTMNGRCDEAIELLRPLKALSPPAGVAAVIGGQCYAAAHMWREAIAEFRWALETTEARAALSFLAYALGRAGRTDEAKSILSDLLAGRKHSHGAFGIATVYAGLRDYDEAFTWLDKAVDENSVRPYIMGPMFEDLRRDARFARVKSRLGL